MFEELFSRQKQSKTKTRSLPKEIDAIQRVKGGSKRNKHSSMSVDNYLWIKGIVIGCIVLVAVGIIATVAYGLVGDFMNYSDGSPVGFVQLITENAKD